MPVIAYWSNYHGQGGTTSNVIATAVNMANKYNLRILLASMEYEKNNMNNAFFSKEKINEINNESGIAALERIAKGKNLNEQNFRSYTTSVLDNRLDLILGNSKSTSKVDEYVSDILYVASKAYDFVFIDANTGIKKHLNEIILKQSDIIVVNLSQNEKVIEDFFEKDKEELLNLVGDKKIIINIGNYDSKLKCSPKYINKIYKNEYDIFCTPYTSDFKDAVNNHKVIDYFMINQNKDNENSYLFDEINKTSEMMMKLAEKDMELLEKPVQKSILDKFKTVFNS